jgi:hypothetical protein
MRGEAADLFIVLLLPPALYREKLFLVNAVRTSLYKYSYHGIWVSLSSFCFVTYVTTPMAQLHYV